MEFVAFINSLKAGTVVFGASGGDISGYEDLMQPTLKTLGLTLYGLNGQFSITFYAKKDFPEFGFQRYVPSTMGPNVLYKDFTEGQTSQEFFQPCRGSIYERCLSNKRATYLM